MPSTTILSEDEHTVTLRTSRRRWNRILQLEATYRLAMAIRRGMNQAETAPAQTLDEALETLRAL